MDTILRWASCLDLAAGEAAASVPRLQKAWRLCVRGAVFAAPAIVPGSGTVLLAAMDCVLHAFSVQGTASLLRVLAQCC